MTSATPSKDLHRTLHRTLLRPSVVAAVGLVGGFAVARATKREVGGGLFGLAGTWCGRQWARTTGPVGAAVLGALYTAAMGGSHPLAKKIGLGTQRRTR